MPGPGSRACPKPERIIDKVRNHIQRRKTVNAEQTVMRKVRAEDRYCRFPLCQCGKLKLQLEVAHIQHRGMGGNRALDRTQPELLILLCAPRHRKHKFSLDKKTLRCEPLTERGLRGPVRWLIDAQMVWDIGIAMPPSSARYSEDAHWFELAVEVRPHTFEGLTEAQGAILDMLSEMTC